MFLAIDPDRHSDTVVGRAINVIALAAGKIAVFLLSFLAIPVLTASAADNAPPVVTVPGDRTYEQGETIAPFGITVTDADQDTLALDVAGLPSGLSYTSDQVQGTVSASAAAQAYTVTITADDGVNTAVTATFTITVTEADQTSPTATISGPTAPQRGAFDVRIAFSEPVTGFEQGDVTVGNGFVRKFSGSGARYRAQVRITPGFSGTVTVDVAANVAADAAGNPNVAASRFSVEGDQSRPTVTIGGPAGLQNGPFGVTFTFTESMKGFERGDVTVGNGSVTAFSGSGPSYTATIAPAGAGTVTVDVAAHVATDATGNPNLPARRFSVRANTLPVITDPGDKTYEQGETITAFGITATDADGDPVTVTVTGLPSGLSYTNGQVQGTVSASAAAQAYTVTITADDGVNTAVTAGFTITVTEADRTSPTVTISGPTVPQRGAFDVGIVFSEPVTGFEQGDVTVGNGFVKEFSGSGARYGAKIRITPGFSGTVTVDVAANVAADAEGNPNVAASRFSVEGDQTRPTVTISGPAGLQNGPFDVTFTFTESMTGFEQGDVTVGNGSVTAFSGSGQSYTATIAPAGAGTVTVDVATHVATDTTGNPNLPARRFSVRANTLPVITDPGDKTYEQGETITAFGITATDADGDPVTVTVTVTGLPSGLSYTNGQVQGTVSTSAAAQAYTVTITADDGVNTAVTAGFTITVTEADRTSPTVTISGPTVPQRGAFDVGIVFSEPVTGFEQGDVTVGNGFVKEFSGSGARYGAKIRITPGFSGTVTVDVAANVAADAEGNPNVAASRFSVEGDQTRPTVTISGPAGLQNGPFDVTFTFTESMTGFEQGDVTVGNGSVTAFSGSGRSYTATIAPAGAGTVTVDVATHVATDATGNPNLPASRYSVQAETAPNAAPVITDPGDKTYERGETITAFGITVTDADGDDVTVTLTGLPAGLSFANGQVQGTLGDDAVPGDHTVTIQADDGGDAPVVETFTITVKAARAQQGQDQTRPTVAISGPTGVQTGGFTVTITFSESVTGFEQSEVTVGNGTVTSFASSGSVATVIITPTASGTVTVDVAENVATDGDGDGNTAATRYSVEADLDAPTVTISGPTTSQSGPFDVTITFSEAVTGLEKADVTVGNGAVTAFSGSGSSYAVSIAPTVAGTVTVDVDAGVAVDGAGNGNTAASRFSVSVSVSRPTTKLEMHGQAEDREGPFSAHIKFSAPVTGFELADVTVTNGQTGPLNVIGETPTYDYYWLSITPTASGTVTVDVAANVAVDEHGNGNTAAPQLSVPVSVTRPSPVITAPTGVQTGPFDVTVTFSEPVTGFERSDIRVQEGADDGSPTAFSGSGATYTATITPTVVRGTVGLFVNRHAAVDADGNKSTHAVGVHVSVDRTVPAAPTLTRTRFNEPTNPALDVRWSAPAVGGETVTGYEARHRRSGGAWIDYAGGLGANSTSFNVPDLVPGAAYEAQVRALRDGVPGPWSKIGSGRANSAPRRATYPPQYPTFTVFWKDTYEKDLRGHYADADGDSFTYSVESLDPGFIEAWISGSSVFVRILNPATAKIRITAYDSYGGVGPNLLPNYFGLARITLSVPENSPAGTAVGNPVTGIPYNGEALEYWLEDPAPGDTMMSDFVVDAASGQIKVKQGAALDYETKRSYTGRTNWGMLHNRTSFALLTINVTDVDDKDASPAVTIADASAAEGDELTFTVRLDKAVSTGLTVTPSFTDGTATKGTDYTENTAAITFTGTAGETQTFTVATTEDADAELDETFTVGLTVSGTTETVTATDTATGTINDDDESAVTIDDASAAEGDSITFTVTLDKAVSGGLTVTPGFTDGTATEGTDYTENPAAITFTGTANETQTFTVATTEDADQEEDETFTVSLAVSGTQATVTATDTATGTINDDDVPAVTIDDASAAEGDSIIFTVTLDKAVSGGLTVTPGFTDGTAIEGTDYTGNTAAITFTGTAGETQTFTVATTEDSDAELDETFIVNLVISGTTTAVTATDTATGTITNDDGAVPAVTIEDAVAVEGDSITFTVTLDKAVSGGLTVTPAFTDETATEGVDYTENTDALTFTGTAGEEQTFTVATTEDTDEEDDETFTVSLTVSGTSATVASDTATGTVTDAAKRGRSPAVVTVADASATEGDSITFTVTLDKAVSGGLTVTPSFTDGTATKGTDYTENTAALTFTGTAGETQTFTVATTEDTEGEPDETFTVGLAVSGLSGTETVTATDTATGTIVDDESPALSIADASASEGDSLTFTVTLDKAASGGLTVAPSFTDGTATKGTDYTENTAAVTFAGAAGETQTFTVATTEDADAELDETFTVNLTVTAAQTPVAATDTATGTITNDDGTVAAVTIEDASAAEGDSITFTVTLDKAVSGGLTVTPAFTDGTATEGTDYTENTGALTFTGTAGETQTFTVATTEDADAELDETFTVNLTVTTAQAPVAATDTATGTITNDDGAMPAVTIEDASATEGDSITFTVTLDKAVSGGLTVTPAFTDGTATEGTDYTANTTALTFTGTAGETQTFTVATTEDADAELDETFTVNLTVTAAQTPVAATDTATGTITNDDGTVAAVTIEDASAAEGDSITFTVTLDKAVSGGLTVTPAFTDGTATEGTDYTENTGALTFTGTAGETQTLTVATTEDADAELDETFTVNLTVTTAQAPVAATDTATGTITNDDGAMPAVTIEDASAAEGDSITFTVTLDKAVSGGLTVTPAFTDGTATEGTDYTENTGALTFTGTAGETQTFTVATTEDAEAELDETFTVNLTVTTAQAPVAATDTATGTITNDDGTVAAVTIEDASAAEGDSITFTVTLDKAVSGGLTVTPAFTDGTATEGTDYTENTGALTFTGTAGETQTFTVATTEDAEAELDETFTVNLTVTTAQAPVAATDTATGTITNDDGTVAAVTIEDASAAEGDSITFTVTLDKAVSGGLTVTPAFTDGTATEGTDYTENTGALTFTGTAGETQTFTVATTEDAEAELDETFTVNLTVTTAQAPVAATDTATGTITNDDGTVAAVTIEDASAAEGDSITFTVTLDKAVSGGLTVTPAFTDGTATEGTDYTENTGALTFTGTAGETQTLTVATTEDAEAELDETFTVNLTVTTAQAPVAATDTATGTITNDDGAMPAVTIEDASAAEGDSITFTVTLDKAVSGGLTVTPAFTDGTATEGTDYTENTGALTFTGTAGETQTFTVATTEDADAELDETFTVNLTVTTAQAPVAATDTATGTITNDDGTVAAVTIEDASATEGDSITFTVTLDKAVSGGLTVTPAFTDGTATEGTDYTENTGALTFTGTAGETQTFTVATTEDAEAELDETFTVNLTVTTAQAPVAATDTATGTITNDDGAMPAVTIEDASATEGDSITFTVTLDKAVSGGLTVTPAFTDGTATEGTDYTANTTALTFTGTAGETQTFTVATAEDSEDEPAEMFTVSLSVSGTTAAVTASDTATGTITNRRRSGATPAVTVADAVADEGNQITFTVTLGRAVSGGLKVTPGFTDVTAASGTDYTENTAPLSFTGTVGETQSFTVATTEDTDVEPAETFTVSLAVSGTTATVTATDTATGTITDDDSAAVTIADASAVEGDPLTFTVTLEKAVSGGLNVTPGFTDVTATSGTDYTENTAPLSFTGTVGETQSFTVATIEDALAEADETFAVGLAVSGTAAVVTATDTATGTITDNGAGQADRPSVVLSGPSEVQTGPFDVAITFSETVTGFEQGEVTVGNGSVESFSGSGAQYTATIRPVSSGTVTVDVAENVAEDEDGNGNTAADQYSVEVDLSARPTDSEVLSLSVDPERVAEDAGPTTVTVTATLSRVFSTDTKVAVQVRSGTATVGSDFQAVNDFDVIVPADQRSGAAAFTLTPVRDTLQEADETVLINGTSDGFNVASAELTIVDNSDPYYDDVLQIRDVAENTPSGEAIGDPVTAHDVDGDELKYGLLGRDADSFSIDETTGQLLTREPLDYEDISSYRVTVGVWDDVNVLREADPEPDDKVQVLIRVTDEDEPPVAPDPPVVLRISQTTTLDVTWVAPENSGRPPITDYDLQYRVVGSNDPFRDAGYDGTDTNARISGVAAGSLFEVRVRATNDEGTGDWSDPGREERGNNPPVAKDDVIRVSRGRTATSLFRDGGSALRSGWEESISPEPGLTSVLANDSDVEDDIWQLEAELVAAPKHGDLKLNPDGTFSYRHDGGPASEDSFIYRVKDSDGAYSNQATVTIMVVSSNRGPVAVGTIPDQTLRLGQDGAVEVAEYFSDPDGDPLTYEVRSWDVRVVTAKLTDSRVDLSPVRVFFTQVTVTASDPEGLSAEQVFGVIVQTDTVDAERMLELSLAALGRTVASQAVDAISGRFRDSVRESHATIGGQRMTFGSGSNQASHAAKGFPGTSGFTGPGLLGTAGLGGPGRMNATMELLRNPAGGPGRPVLEPVNLPGVGTGFGAGASGLGGLDVFSDRNGMSGSSFQWSPEPQDSQGSQGSQDRAWALWGQGVGTFFSGLSLNESRLDGQVGAAYVGADHSWGSKAVLGLAVSHSRGVLEYEDVGVGAGELGANLTTVHPYVHWSPREGLGLWSLMGVGQGSAELEAGGDATKMGIDIRMAAVGGRNELARLGGVDLALKGDAFAVSIGSEGVAGLRTVNGDARRVRMMLEGSSDFEVSPHANLTPSLELGVRLDGGDAETGLGAELAGGLSYVNRRLGLRVETRGHGLVAHQDGDFKERGVSLGVRLDPGADRKGWSLRLAPVWGAPGGGAEAMWRDQAMRMGGSPGARREELSWRPDRAQAAVAYGFGAGRARSVLEPFAMMSLDGRGSPRLGGGMKLEIPSLFDSPGRGLMGDRGRGLRLELTGDYRPPQRNMGRGLLSAEGTSSDYRIGASFFISF